MDMAFKKWMIFLWLIVLCLFAYVWFYLRSESYEEAYIIEQSHQTYIEDSNAYHTFAGEAIHFTHEKTYQLFFKELESKANNKSSTRLMLSEAALWLPLFEEILVKNNIPKDFKYIPIVESNLQNSISKKGAVGYWQFTKNTAIDLGLEVNDEVDQRLDPLKSSYAAVRLLKRAYKVFDSWILVAVAYNRGIQGLEKAMKKQDANYFHELSMNKETASYIYKLIAIKHLYENKNDYGFKNKKRFKAPTKKIKVTTSITSLTEFAQLHGVTLQQLKTANPWLIANALTIKKENDFYILEIPLKK
jgi:membrane-bound lytic murein transglycosylase D